MTEADGEDRYNTAVFIGPDGTLLGKYRKQQLDHESVRNTAGSVSAVHETTWGKVGIMICADRRYPDLVRKFCDNGAGYLICPSGGMFGPKSNDPIVQARSKENGVRSSSCTRRSSSSPIPTARSAIARCWAMCC